MYLLINYFLVYERYFGKSPEVSLLSQKAKDTIAQSNLYLLNTMKELIGLFDLKNSNKSEQEVLENYRENIVSRHEYYRKQINGYSTKLYQNAGFSPALI